MSLCVFETEDYKTACSAVFGHLLLDLKVGDIIVGLKSDDVMAFLKKRNCDVRYVPHLGRSFPVGKDELCFFPGTSILLCSFDGKKEMRPLVHDAGHFPGGPFQNAPSQPGYGARVVAKRKALVDAYPDQLLKLQLMFKKE